MSPGFLEFQIEPSDFTLVRELVYKHCGISLGEEKLALVQARISRQVRLGGYGSARNYLDKVVADRKGRIFVEFIDAISTNLTSFFREKAHFEYLSQTALPELFARRKDSNNRNVLAWSAACSSGEEPYSMAITLLEAAALAAPQSMPWDFRILASDISTRMLGLAREGIYSAQNIRTIPAQLRSKYFTFSPGNGDEVPVVAVTPALRRLVRFRHLNLMDSWPFKGPFDFIFCRNVMIYFDKPTQERLVDRLWGCLRNGGLLFTGHSESLTGVGHRFANARPSIYQKIEAGTSDMEQRI